MHIKVSRIVSVGIVYNGDFKNMVSRKMCLKILISVSYINVMSSWNINNNELILKRLIRAMSLLTERN